MSFHQQVWLFGLIVWAYGLGALSALLWVRHNRRRAGRF